LPARISDGVALASRSRGARNIGSALAPEILGEGSMAIKVRILKTRKILVASLGLATLSFTGAACDTTVANLMAPPPCQLDPKVPDCIGPHPDSGTDAGTDANDAATDAPVDTAEG
jgi:hypothetical protein